MDEVLYWENRKVKPKYWASKVKSKCSRCKNYEWSKWDDKNKRSQKHKCSLVTEQEKINSKLGIEPPPEIEQEMDFLRVNRPEGWEEEYLKLKEERAIEEELELLRAEQEKVHAKKFRNYLHLGLAAFFGEKDVHSLHKEQVRKQKERVRKLTIEKARIDDRIQSCLNSRTYLAVKERKDYFYDQYQWGIVECSKCDNYIPEFNYCILDLKPKKSKLICNSHTLNLLLRRLSDEEEVVKL